MRARATSALNSVWSPRPTPTTMIGSYPFFDEKGDPNTNIVVRARDPDKLAAAKAAVETMLVKVKAEMTKA